MRGVYFFSLSLRDPVSGMTRTVRPRAGDGPTSERQLSFARVTIRYAEKPLRERRYIARARARARQVAISFPSLTDFQP